MRLDLIDNQPIFCPRHRLSRVEWDIIDSKVEELAKFGLVEPATGSYAAATVLPVKKDADGNYTDRRMCGDYRVLNLETEQDRYPYPGGYLRQDRRLSLLYDHGHAPGLQSN